MVDRELNKAYVNNSDINKGYKGEEDFNKTTVVKKNSLKRLISGKNLLIGVSLLYLLIVLVFPVIFVFIKAFSSGISEYFSAISEPYTLSALKLTLITIIITVPINTIFGVAAAYTITKFDFKGKNILISLIDLPFSISPIIAGLVFVLMFSTNHGIIGGFLSENNIKIIFTPVGIVIATLFVTMPFVAKELIPIMESIGSSEEEAALSLGASGFQTFFKITLPNIKWAVFYGIILTTSRAAGEFGAVAVVSGHIRGYTNTLPLHIETLYNEYQFNAAFAVASLLTLIALINLILKNLIKWKSEREEKEKTWE